MTDIQSPAYIAGFLSVQPYREDAGGKACGAGWIPASKTCHKKGGGNADENRKRSQKAGKRGQARKQLRQARRENNAEKAAAATKQKRSASAKKGAATRKRKSVESLPDLFED